MDPRRWGPLIAAVSLTLFPWGLARSAERPVRREIPPATDAPVPEEPKKPADENAGAYGAGVFARADRQLQRRLDDAKKLLALNRYAEAVESLDAILNAPEDYFLASRKTGYIGLKAEVQRLLGAMPREGRRLYEDLCGARARQLLDRAVAGGDPRGIAEVARRYFHTQAGYEATLLLGLHYMDNGSPLAGAMTLKRLHEAPWAADSYEPALSVAIAICWYRAGMAEEAEQTLEAARQKYPGAKVRIGGVEVALAADDRQLLGGNPKAVAAGSDNQPWLLVGGNPARNASTSGSGPLLSVSWSVPTTEHPHIEAMIDELQRSYREQDEWALPNLFPLVVNDVVLMRTARNLLAVDFATGKRLWEVPTDDPFETLTETDTDSPFPGSQPFDTRTGVRFRLWGDATYGALSSDGNLVFAIEDLSLDVNPAVPQQIMFNNPREQRVDPRSFNRLAAYEIRTGKLAWNIGGSPDEFPLPQAGSFFLGAPLPLGGQLYVLAESKGEIRLLALEPRTGKLQWSQLLSVIDQDRDVLQEPVRRLAGASPAYAEGVLVCPTSNHAVVALELSTRSLLWGFAYSDENPAEPGQLPGGFAGPRPPSDPDPAQRWAQSGVVLGSGKAVLAAADSNQIHCVDLLSGKLIWKKPREDNLYVACIDDDRVVLAGRKGMRALRLADGATAWEHDLPDGVLPSGAGFVSGGQYFLPLSSGEVAAVDLKTGNRARTYKSRRGAVPGNLVCYRGRVLSQRAGALEMFYQLDSLRKRVEDRLAASPNDPEILAQRGEILWDEGKLDEAIASFRRAYELAPGPNVANLLREAYLDGLRVDFAAYQRFSPDIQKLIDEPRQEKAYLRRMAVGFETAGDYRAALAHYIRLIELDRQQRDLETIEAGYQVRGDRWVQVQLTSLRTIAPPPIQAEIDRYVQSQYEAAQATGTAEAFQQFLNYFAGQPQADAARWQLADLHRRAKHYLQAELLLRQLSQSADRGQMGRALAELAVTLRQARAYDDAARVYRRLEREFADQTVLDDKTGKELVTALPADDPVKKLLAPSQAWPTGEVVQSRDRQKPQPQLPPAFTTATVPFPDGRGAFFADLNLELAQGNQRIVARDGWGNERWQLPVGEILRQDRYAMQSGNLRATSQDHLLLLSLGSRLVAIDALGTGTGGPPSQLWLQELEPGRDSPPAAGRPRLRALRMQRLDVYSPYAGSMCVPAAVSEQLICYQRFHQLYGADPATGQTLWVRDDVRPESLIFGDDRYVLVANPEGTDAIVLQAADGKLLGKRSLPQMRLAMLGRYVLTLEHAMPSDDDPFGHDAETMKLVLMDPWSAKPVWTAGKFSADAKTVVLEKEAVGVYEPNGRFVLVDMRTGKTLITAKIERESSVSEIHLIATDEGYYLLLNGLERRPSNVQTFGIHSLPAVQVQRGKLFGFDRQGKKLWDKGVPIEDQFLLSYQPSHLPMLFFACQTQDRRSPSSGQQRLSLLGVDKRTGRVLKPKESLSGSSNLRLSGNPDKKTVEVQLQADVLTLAFTDKTPTETVEKPRPSRALWKAIERGTGE